MSVVSSRRRTSAYLWFFGILAVLGGAAIAISWIYNARQQLTLEELNRHRDLWRRQAPRDYVWEFTKNAGNPETFIVTVRGGKVTSVLMKQTADPAGQYLKGDDLQLNEYSMEGAFGWLEEFLKVDAKPGSPRAFNRAIFDPRDGRLLDYVRSADRQRVEIRVKRLEAGTESK